MSLNLALLQQKINNLLFNITKQMQIHFDLFYNPQSQDIELDQYDEEQNLQTIQLPNYAKMQKISAPIGMISLFSGLDVSQGWKICNADEVKIEDYPALYELAKKGTDSPLPPFAPGSDELHFLLPDLNPQINGVIYIIKVN